MAKFSVHYDGSITIEHKVTIRVLSKTYEHMQRAIDRAYLIEQYGDVWKHARLKSVQYEETEFLAEYPREGGIILDAVRDGAGALVDRIASAVRPVFDRAANQSLEQFQSIDAQLNQRYGYINDMGNDTQTFESVAANPPSHWASSYSNRSIIKEIDQLAMIITPKRLEGSVVEIGLYGNSPHLPFVFTPQIANRFHRLSARRELGPAMIVNAKIRSLDRGNKHSKPSAKIENLSTHREVTLHLPTREDFDVLHPHHNGSEVQLYVSPIVEAMGFDLNGGDLMFLDVV